MTTWIKYEDLELAEITRQVIAAKRARKEDEPEYDDLEDFIKKTCTVFCAVEENKYEL